MANENNIIPASARTPSERRRIAQRAGIASGKSRRRRKAMRELLELALSNKTVGPKGESKSNAEWITLALIRKAMKGDVHAYETICEYIGEGVSRKVELSRTPDVDISFGDLSAETIAIFIADVNGREYE